MLQLPDHRRTIALREVGTVRAGFTLLELVLVMVIICTVLAMAAPSLRGFFGSRQTADAASRIVALTQYARSQAAAEGRPYRLNLDAQEGRYWLTAQTAGAYVTLPSEFGRVFHLPDGATARWESPAETAERGWTAFFPDGRAQAAEIRLKGRRGEVMRVVCWSPAEAFEAVAGNEGD